MLILKEFFYFDNLSLLMICFVGFVALSVASFASRYLKGDRKQGAFYVNLFMLIATVFVMVVADHLLVFLATWGISNFFLTRLMLHKKEWEAARQSAILAMKNFGLGFAFLAGAFVILFLVTGETSIQKIIYEPIEKKWLFSCGVLLLLAAMTQSSLWPFHKWLTSSLNSPTPVSAIMHAGLVNGGGFLLARFAQIFLKQPLILDLIFIVGIVTALLGTLWKLMQSDVKRMLACSTMGQMGFMIVQCGLGLFGAAVVHLCWHGFFKAYLFLASGGAAQEKRLDLKYPPMVREFVLAVVCGVFGAFTFSHFYGFDIFAANTTFFLVVMSLIAGSQFALPIVRSDSTFRLPVAVFATIFAGAFYGFSVNYVEQFLSPLAFSAAQPLNFLHWIALIFLVLAWLLMIFRFGGDAKKSSDWILKAYVKMLNASQPHAKTITASHNQYRF